MPLFRATTALAGEAGGPRAPRRARRARPGRRSRATSTTTTTAPASGTSAASSTGRPTRPGLALLARLHARAGLRASRGSRTATGWRRCAPSSPRSRPGASSSTAATTGRGSARTGSALEIEAAQAFGTGHHATTQGCLLALDRLVRQGLVARRVADIGGGTGVLAMAAASVWPAVAIAGDIDPLATATARANVAANGLAGRVACVTAAGFRHPRLHAGAPYDLIFAEHPRRAAQAAGAASSPRTTRRAASRSCRASSRGRRAGVTAVYRAWGYRPGWSRCGSADWTTLVLRALTPTQRRARASATSAISPRRSPMSLSCAVRQAAAAPGGVARALRQATRRLDDALGERDDDGRW